MLPIFDMLSLWVSYHLHELNEGIVLKIVDAIWSDEEIQRKIGI
jgi:hypothetical protein